jgi:hypothetical protein
MCYMPHPSHSSRFYHPNTIGRAIRWESTCYYLNCSFQKHPKVSWLLQKLNLKRVFCLFLARQPPVGQGLSFKRFLDHTQWRTTVGRTSLDEWSARCRDLYLTTHNTHNRQTHVPLVGFEPTRLRPRGHWDRL